MELRSPIDAQALLANAGWMRALASRLLEDDSAADDVVQDATIAALRHGPADEAGLAPWLSRVVRNFAYRKRRDDARRARREEFAAVPRAEPTPVEVAERLELQRVLVDAVSALEEPFRRTIVLRYLESRSCVEIAELYGIPEGTVRWRSMRGLELLRKELDARTGSRMQWSAMLLTFTEQFNALPAAASAAVASSKVVLGVFAMKAAHAAAAGIAALVLGGLAWWGFQRIREEPQVAAAPAPTTLAEALPEPVAPAADATPAEPVEAARSSVATEPAPVSAPIKPPPLPVDRFAFVDAHFVDAIGNPWSGVRLQPIAPPWLPTWNPGEGAISETDGRVLLQIALPSRRDQSGMQMRQVKIDLVASRAGSTSVGRSVTLREGETSHLGDIVIGPGVRVLGRAVDSGGKGVAQVRIGVAPALLDGEEGRMARHGSPSFQTTPGSSTSSNGEFAIEGVPPGKLRLWAHAKGLRYAWSEPIDVVEGSDTPEITIVMSPLLDTDRIAGHVLDPDGAPVANVDVQCQEHWRGGGLGTFERVDAQGRFEIIVEHGDSLYDFTASDFYERFAAQTVAGVKPGTLDVVIRMLPSEQFTVRVKDPQGAPIENARFDVMSQGSKEFLSTSSAPGEYSIARPGEPFILTVWAKGFRENRLGSRRAMLQPASLSSGLDIVLQPAKLLRGRVTADGEPVAGARVHIAPDHPDADGTVAGYRYRYLAYPDMDKEVITDADGRYEIDCSVEGGYDVDKGFWLRAMADGWAATEIGPIFATELEKVAEFNFELTGGGAIEGRVLLPNGRDAEGSIVAFNHGDGFPRTIRAGKGGTFRVEGLATGKWQVLHAKDEVDPDRTRFAGEDFDAPMEWNCEVQAGVTTHFDLDLTKQ